MIRVVVNFLNKWHKFSRFNPTEIIENRYPTQTFALAQQAEQNERCKFVKEQKYNAWKATASPLEKEFADLKKQFSCSSSKMSIEQYESKWESLKEKESEENLKSKWV